MPRCDNRADVTGVYRFVEHTGEVEIELRAPSREDVLALVTEALAELVGVQGQPSVAWDVDVEAADAPALLAAWVDELVFRAEVDGLVALRVSDVILEEGRARGRVEGVRSPVPHLVKGATYHRLALEPDEDGWTARIVLDV